MPRPMDIIDPKKDLDKVEDKDVIFEDKKDGKDDSFEIEESKSGGAFYLILGIIALVVATSFAFYILYKDKDKGKEESKVETTETVDLTKTASASATESASPEDTSTTLSIGSPGQSSTATTSFSSSSVRIANGNGKEGEAQKIKTLLEGKGFSITSIGNATKTYEETTIFYKSGKSDLADALAEAIKGTYSATTKESDVTVGSYDAVIALGKK